MTKFVCAMDGTYINIDHIVAFMAYADRIVITIYNGDDIVLVTGVGTLDENQEWLDAFIEKHGLSLDSIHNSRCF